MLHLKLEPRQPSPIKLIAARVLRLELRLNGGGATPSFFPPVSTSSPVTTSCLPLLADNWPRSPAQRREEKLKDTNSLKEEGTDPALLDGWTDQAELARELTLSVDTLQRWETRRVGPPCVRVGRKVLYRMEAVRDWLRDQEARKTGQNRVAAVRR